MNKGDILGHEFCGIVEQVGPAVKKVQVGKRYVASFQIACGEVRQAQYRKFHCLMLLLDSRIAKLTLL